MVEGVLRLFQDQGKSLNSGATEAVRGRQVLVAVPKMLFIIQEP